MISRGTTTCSNSRRRPSFSVVEFVDELGPDSCKKVDIIPSKWLEGPDRNECWWPPSSMLNVAKAVEEGMPPARNWTLREVRVLANAARRTDDRGLRRIGLTSKNQADVHVLNEEQGETDVGMVTDVGSTSVDKATQHKVRKKNMPSKSKLQKAEREQSKRSKGEQSPKKQSSKKVYNREDVALALGELQVGGSLRKVAAKYHIPHTTLQDYKKNKYMHHPHPNRILTPAEEDALVDYIRWMSEHGFSITHAVAKTLALEMVEATGRPALVNLEGGFSKMWWFRFRRRHWDRTSRTPDTLDRNRPHGATEEAVAVDGLFSLIEPLYAKHGLGDKPHLIFNCDETVFGQTHSREMVFCQKHVDSQQNTLKDPITVHCCVSASGESIPPLIIFTKSLPKASYALDGPKDALYGVSKEGYMDSDLFVKWLGHFVKYAPTERPLVLFLDQRETHVSKDVVNFCQDKGIELVCLPANTTHMLQPLDVSVLGPLKLASQLGLVRGDRVSKRRFSALFKCAYRKAVTPTNIKSGFSKTGLFPLDRAAVDSPQIVKTTASASRAASTSDAAAAPDAAAVPDAAAAPIEVLKKNKPSKRKLQKAERVQSKRFKAEHQKSPKKQSPRKGYNTEDVAQALEDLKAGGSLRKVAAKYHIPHTTLQDYKKKKYLHQPHPNRALSPAEEDALVAYIQWMSDRGFPITRTVAKTLAFQMVKASGRPTMVNLEGGLSKMWWSRFRTRHPNISARKADTLDRKRVHGATKVAVDGLFSLIEPLYAKHGLGDKPHLIFNCDETGFGQTHSREKVLCRKGQKHVYSQQSTSRDPITVHCCVSASGESIPPFIIFAKCLPNDVYGLEGPKDALYGVSEKGYMDSDLFVKWLEHFVKHAPTERPLVMFLDQHETHVSKDTVDFCRGKGIELVCLPANTTHMLQPLDVSVFGPLKNAFTKLASSLGLVRGDLVVSKRRFSAVIKHAYLKAVTPANIMSGFRKTGLFPLDRAAVDYSQIVKITSSSSRTAPGASAVSPGDASSSIATAARSCATNRYGACSTCGSKPNPLVLAGLIPEELANILVPPKFVKSDSPRKRLPLPARVITSEEYAALLEEKLAEERAKQDKKRRRKRKKKEEC
ncbi:hypothetical protein AALO_G00281080 [Alosa alosa]|uniref:HTH CENPB-type domain-containing protein n=1 Tax=Alosa alosa TaxID=278164 RepID=A0AAV6FRE6_9TELE|nr:hypothetical protein AALO_G00281080 [Alosa alosa]